MSVYQGIRCTVPTAVEEELPVLLAGFSVLGTEIGERDRDRLWITVYLPPGATRLREDVEECLAAHGADDLRLETVEDEDWLARYTASVRAFPVGGDWWVDPHPESPTAAPPGRRRLVMPPRMAFGSGSHESTSLILGGLHEAGVRGRTVLDVGTGSGILALAADALGARQVMAVDIDPVAIHTAVQMCSLQEWRPKVQFVLGSAGCAAVAVFDIVVCNMITAHLFPLLEEMKAALAPGGALVLSGILQTEVRSVESRVKETGLTLQWTREQGEWACLGAERTA